ncbi:alpha/beta hydrolase-fold protein [Sphingomonas sp.]|uniref:alpha/beta hydrolase n=1 Tax=Sphingomonas sp. TaxID=28214 RepID=UPI00286E3F15|nr:alpha/beta hydrolase-fold protein [Sphingomonas sp.]
MRQLAILLALLTAVTGTAVARPAAAPSNPLVHLPAIAGDYFPLASAATGLTYHIFIRYPQGYADDRGHRYPIVYLLDGDSAFPLLASQHLFLTIDDKLPEAIVVGIAYGGFDPKINKRDVDFGERSEAFHRFLEAELFPRVEAASRGDPLRRVLVGQSYGGSFVLWSALNRPDAFWGRIASNPSFRLHSEKLWEPPTPPRRSGLRLYVVSGTANAAEPRQQAIRWVDEQGRRLSTGMITERIDLKDGTHAADLPAAYRSALRKLFDWKPAAPDAR